MRRRCTLEWGLQVSRIETAVGFSISEGCLMARWLGVVLVVLGGAFLLGQWFGGDPTAEAAEQYPAFFERCGALLAPGGLLALQAITIPDRRYERARREVDFIKRHVFPGSCIPSVTALVGAATAASDLGLRHLEDFTPHYARTLAAWRENLEARRAEVARLADARFRRLWHFYLCYCEGGFRERSIGVVQMLFARPGAR
jgi:cyclopropane-fatty-acyl-phospholipid synthase